MRHHIIGRHLGRSPSHRRMLMRTMVTQLFKHERIITTAAKAKELKRFAEPMVTLSKKGTLAAKRAALAYITEPDIVDKIFREFPTRYAERSGGYTSVKQLSQLRKGDRAQMALIAMVDGPLYGRLGVRRVSRPDDMQEESQQQHPESPSQVYQNLDEQPTERVMM